MSPEDLKIFALGPSRDFGDRVANHLGSTLGDHEEREFEDGEHTSRPLVNVRGKEVFVIQSLYGDSAQSVNCMSTGANGDRGKWRKSTVLHGTGFIIDSACERNRKAPSIQSEALLFFWRQIR
jgi:hypothetical protein